MKKGAIVTGGASKIGGALSLALAKAGFDVFLMYNNSLSGAECIRRSIINDTQSRCVTYRLDLRNTEHCGHAVKTAFDMFPYCNVLINNASVFRRLSVADTSWQYLEENLKIHTIAPFELSKSFSALCAEGHIINIADHITDKLSSAFFGYAVSKAALLFMSDVMRREAAPGVKVTALTPKPVLSDADNAGYFNGLRDDDKITLEEFINDVLDIIKL